MAWREISLENLVAAKSLAMDARWRSSVSRAYYAAYSAVASRLEGVADYPNDRQGPSHDLLPKLVMTYLTTLGLYDRRIVVAASKRLYRQRIAADYEPESRVEVDESTSAIRDASVILRMVLNA